MIHSKLKEMDEITPLPGPGWINWRVVMTTLVGAVLLGIGGLVGPKLVVIWNLPEIVEQHEQYIIADRQNHQAIADKLDMIIAYQKKSRVLIGKMVIGSTGAEHNTRPGIWVNEFSAASTIDRNQTYMLSNLEDSTQLNIEVRVLGTVKITDANCLGVIGNRAARAITVNGARTEIQVQLTPVD